MNYDAFAQVLVMSMAVSVMSLTITRSRIFHEFREWVKSKNDYLGDLVSCFYCTSHWLAIGFTTFYKPQILNLWIGADLVLSMFVMVAGATLVSGAIQKLVNVGHYMDRMVPEDDDEEDDEEDVEDKQEPAAKDHGRNNMARNAGNNG